MKLSQHERYIFVLQALLKAYPDIVTYLDMRQVLLSLEQRKNTNGLQREYEKGKILVSVEAIAWYDNNRYCCLLIGCGDNTIPPHQYKDLRNGAVRSPDKADHEAPAYAAHVVIDTAAFRDHEPIFSCLIERVPSLSIGRIRSFLSAEIKEAYRETIQQDSKQKSYTATLELNGHASHTIREALETGTLKHISVVSHSLEQDAHDEETYIEEQTAQIGMKIKRGIESDQALNLVERTANKYKILDTGKYDTMLVRVKTQQGPTKQTAIDLESETDVLEQAFYHQEKICDFASPLESSPTSIRDDVVQKMISLMPNEDN